MKKLKIITVNDRIPNFFIYPIRKNRKTLQEQGYDVKFLYKHTKDISCDILCLMSIYFTAWWDKPEKVFSFIEEAKQNCNKIIWLDDNDSTGVTHFELLPHIDLYLKKQLLKDKSLYSRPLYGDRIFTDYYHKEFGIEDKTLYQSEFLDMTYANKVHLSWHIGLGDMIGDILPGPINYVRYMHKPIYPKILHSVKGYKEFDFMFKGTRKYARNTVSYHREEIGRLLDNMTQFKAILKGRVSVKEYKRQMNQSKVVVSPFGWGEIGVRDFEAWIYGAALMKPDMTFMETWPDVFIPNETYYPINWSFDNLESGLSELIENNSLRLELAENGQKKYSHMISDKGMEEFCDWFIQQVEK